MTTNLKNISDFAKKNNNSFSDYNNLDAFREKLAFTKIKKNKNTLNNLKGGSAIGNFMKAANTASKSLDSGLQAANKASNVLDNGLQIMDQVGVVANKTGVIINNTSDSITNATNAGKKLATQLIPQQIMPSSLKQVSSLEEVSPLQPMDVMIANNNSDDNDSDSNDSSDNEIDDEQIKNINIGTTMTIENNNNNNDNETNIDKNEIKSNLFTIERGTILYYPTETKLSINEKKLDFGDKISMFTPDNSQAISKMNNCLNKGSIHVFSVKNEIPDIRIGNIDDLELMKNIEKLDKKFCNKTYRGIMFNISSNVVGDFIKENNNMKDDKKNFIQYWLCNPATSLTYMYSQTCLDIGELSKKVKF